MVKATVVAAVGADPLATATQARTVSRHWRAGPREIEFPWCGGEVAVTPDAIDGFALTLSLRRRTG
jgi:hypothetical protein